MTETNATRVFSTPELLDIICDYTQHADCTQLVRTSRLAFNLAAPRIWKTLDTIQPLLMLLDPTTLLGQEDDINVG
jgi:hypothetical protein